MDNICGAMRPGPGQLFCTKKKHDDPRHAALVNDDVVAHWVEPPSDPKMTVNQIKSLIKQEEEKITHTLSTLQGERSVLGDVMRSILPAHQAQLLILKGILSHIEE